MKKQKLMILIWNMGIGGIQKRVKDIIIEVTNNQLYKNTEVYLVVKHEENSFFIQELNDRADHQRLHIVYYTPSHPQSKGVPSFYWIFKQYLLIKPDVLLTFLDHLSIFAVWLKTIVLWHSCSVVLNEGVLTSRFIRLNRGRWAKVWLFLVRVFYPFADQIIVPSQAVKKDLVTKFSLASSKIVVIPNWTLFKPHTTELKSKYDLAYIGRFETEKNPMLFLAVVKAVHKVKPNLKVCMVGSGRLETTIKHFIAHNRLKNNVKLLKPENNMQKVLSECKLLLVTSKNEGMPNVVLEAGMLQVPSIVTPFLGAEEVIIDGKTGWIRSNQPELTSLILSLLSRPQHIYKVGKQAQQHMTAHFSERNQKRFISTLLHT